MSVRRAAVLAGIVTVMFVLKRHYSTAAVEDLRWILGPTTVLVATVSGSAFEFEPGAGYLCRELFFVIAKPCAGLNFMIAALGVTGVGLSRDPGSGRPLGPSIVVASLALSYAAALLVNATRILIAIRFPSIDLASGWWTASRIHRLEGIAVYFAGLLAVDLLVRAAGWARRRGWATTS